MKRAETKKPRKGRSRAWRRFSTNGWWRARGTKKKFEEEKRKRFGTGSLKRPRYTTKGESAVSPSYFNGIDLDIIDPRNRKTRTGTVPIVMEMVPPGCRANFGMIYLPFDLLGHEEVEMRKQQRGDWNVLGEALFRNVRVSGFGVKKTSGSGKAQMKISSYRFECGMPGFRPPAVQQLERLKELGNCF